MNLVALEGKATALQDLNRPLESIDVLKVIESIKNPNKS